MTETASSRLTRLLALVPWLLAHDGVTLAECAEHFHVSEEQLERDLWLLVVCGTPGYGPDQLVDIQFWDDGRIHVLDPQTLDRALRLTQEEAITLLVALRMLAQIPGVEDRDAIASATAKIEEAVGLATGDRPVAVAVPSDPEVARAIDVALAEGRSLDIRYASATRDELTTRVIDPLRLFTLDGRSYLEAYCRSAEAVRTFRVDRVIAATPVDGPVDGAAPTPPDTGSALPQVPREEAVLALRPEARWILDVYGSAADPADTPGEVLARVPLHSLDWGVRLVLSLRGQARVVEPPELAEAVAHAARGALGAYPDA